jgi:hypothetical protein
MAPAAGSAAGSAVGRTYGVMTARWGWQPFAWWEDGLPTWSWRGAPGGLVTRRQMRARGLAPGGAAPVARVVCRRGARWAYLYDPTELVAKREATAAQWVAVATAIAARRWCPTGGHYVDYCVPTSLGECVACHYREDTTGVEPRDRNHQELGSETTADTTTIGRAVGEAHMSRQSVPGVRRAHAALAWLRQRQAVRQARVQEPARVEQLTRWHTDDHTADTENASAEDASAEDAVAESDELQGLAR